MPYETEYPWLVKDAVVFLDEFLKDREATVLEFGAGCSTLWFSSRVKKIHSVEASLRWIHKIEKKVEGSPSDNVRLIHRKGSCYDICDTFPDESFDLVLIDARDRVKCFNKSVRLIKPGGVLMLDNSERKRYWSALSDALTGSRLKRRGQCPYKKILPTWESFSATGPDYAGGFNYPGWETTWWVRPRRQ